MYSNFIVDAFNELNTKLKDYLPNTVRYTIFVTIFLVFIGVIYSTGILGYFGNLTKGNPRIATLILVFLFLVFIKEIYYTGKNYSFLFEGLIFGLLVLLSLIYKNNKNYQYVFIYLLVIYALFRLGQILKTNTIEELINKYELKDYDNLTYDLLVVKNEKACRIKGRYNDNNNQLLNASVDEKNQNNSTCTDLIKNTNLNFVAKWNDIISFGSGNKKIGEDCDENWWTQLSSGEPEDNTCKPGLTCKGKQCTEVNKKIDTVKFL